MGLSSLFKLEANKQMRTKEGPYWSVADHKLAEKGEQTR